MRHRTFSVVIALISIGALQTSGAPAADLGGNCCADLEQRIAELEATTARKGNRILTITGLAGGQPRYVVVDPTSFALDDNALRFIGSDIANILRNTLTGNVQGSTSQTSGQMNLGAGPSEASGFVIGPVSPPIGSPGVWGVALGGRADHEHESLSDADDTYAGGIGGATFRVSPSIIAGAFAGGATNSFETQFGKTIDTDYVLGGVYGRAVMGSWFVDASVTGGQSDSDSSRRMVTTAPGVTITETAQADYDGSFLLPALRVGAYLPVAGGAFLVPSAQVRYIWQHLDSYEESGSSANLAIGDRDLESLEERFELGMQQSFGIAGGPMVTLTAGAGLVLYQRVGDRNVDVALVGNALEGRDPGGDENEIGAFGRAGFNAELGGGLSLFGDAQVLKTEETEAYSGSAGVKLSF